MGHRSSQMQLSTEVSDRTLYQGFGCVFTDLRCVIWCDKSWIYQPGRLQKMMSLPLRGSSLFMEGGWSIKEIILCDCYPLTPPPIGYHYNFIHPSLSNMFIRQHCYLPVSSIYWLTSIIMIKSLSINSIDIWILWSTINIFIIYRTRTFIYAFNIRVGCRIFYKGKKRETPLFIMIGKEGYLTFYNSQKMAYLIFYNRQ